MIVSFKKTRNSFGINLGSKSISTRANFDHKVREQWKLLIGNKGEKSNSLKVSREHAIPWEALKRGVLLSNTWLLEP